MRFTTKLSTLITLLVALAMFLMLMGCSYSFFYVTQDRLERRFDSLVTSLDQSMLQGSPDEQQQWLPLVMRPLGIVAVSVDSGRTNLLTYKLPTLKLPWDSLNGYRQVSLPLLQHPGSSLNITYIDPFASDVRSLQSTGVVTLSIVVMLVILLFSLRWLREQAEGEDRLERRARRILNGERESVMQGDVREWPANVSGALDRLLADLAEAREERSRVDTLIRAFAAQDAKTGLNNRLFFDNQLATQLEEEGSHGIVMMVRLPDFDTLRETHGNNAVQELMYSLVNLLSTFVMRYPAALLARYFHSDFTVLLPHRTLKEADGIAAQLVNAIDALPSTALIDREAFLHIGIVAYRSGQTTEQVIDYAEQATRHATLQGGNGWYVYDSQVPEKGRGSVKWRTLLEQVLVRGGPRLYQKPAVTVEGDVHHREIMSRIYDGTQELLPSEYMPLVQQLGLAESYDRQHISRILPLLALWPEETLAFTLCVDSLLQRSFQRWLRDTLLQCEKSHRRRILIELAEADVCQHIDPLRPVLRLLSGLGCRLAVSQAGLTVVSASYIKSLPVEIVKLHPGLVRGIDKRDENQLFVQSLTGACEGTSARVFAASVRTNNEWQTLKERGILGGQGDFFAPPEPIDVGRKKYSRRYRV
ncbi:MULTISPECIES: RNase E specificity factor CsrD [unclassified Serratia (in: enterobacteria)]|uniref:RNase E specificity factor CsrD n=1 Tax=unclassified Serratia (in: enterobacteria) TaxID=2647522 RepID=UPI002ED3C407|nr:RNase E specificity factor CsrD [Serratia sp. C2(2)]MEE4448849.1 RNase E specificity factor CsrD [Serratia sp. C2(1)]